MNKKIIVLLALTALMGHLVQSQTLIDNYRVSTGVDTTQWIDITGQDTVLLATHAGTMSSGRSVSNDIGFTFPFADTSFTQFGVNIHGMIRMGGSTSLTPFWQTNPLTRVANMPLIVPFGIQGQIDTSCYVRCATVGAAGSQVLVVEMRMKIYIRCSGSRVHRCPPTQQACGPKRAGTHHRL